MANRRTDKQNELIEWLESTYLVRKYVSPYDFAIVVKPSLFKSNKKKDRSYNNAVVHAREDFKTIDRFMRHLQPKYRLQILNSVEFGNLMESSLGIDGMAFHKQIKEEKERSLVLGLQMYDFARHLIKMSMPKSFYKTLAHSAKPFDDLLEAIGQFAKQNKVKDFPDFQLKPFIVE